MTRTLGQDRCNMGINPTDSATVKAVRRRLAEVIDMLHRLPQADGETMRCRSIAMTEIEGANHWAVKAVAMAERAATAPESA